MAEVTDAPPAAAATEERCMSAQGSHIWYELMTPDPDTAKRFYDAVVPGWSFGERMAGEMDYRMINRSDGGMAGGVLRLTEDMAAHGARPIWLGYVAVDDVDGMIARIEAKGGKVLMPASDIPDVGRIAMVADPQGNPFYVMRPTPPKGDETKVSDVFSTTEEQRVGWNELSTPDPVAARRFYGDLFGWESGEFMDMGEYGDYRFFDHQGTRIGAVSGVVAGAPQGWRYYIRVPSIAKAAEAVKAGGGSVSMGPMEVPGGDHIIIGQDPQGAEFALVGKA
jgi:predicted enzyme related to lactoylglutathione lyase